MKYNKVLLIDNIYNAAKERKITMKSLEKYAGVSIGYFLRMRTDVRNVGASPTLHTMVLVSEKLDLSLDTLVSGEVHAPPKVLPVPHTKRYKVHLVRQFYNDVWMDFYIDAENDLRAASQASYVVDLHIWSIQAITLVS